MHMRENWDRRALNATFPRGGHWRALTMQRLVFPLQGQHLSVAVPGLPSEQCLRGHAAGLSVLPPGGRLAWRAAGPGLRAVSHIPGLAGSHIRSWLDGVSAKGGTQASSLRAMPPRKPIQRNPTELLRLPPGRRQAQRAVWPGLRRVPHVQGLAGSHIRSWLDGVSAQGGAQAGSLRAMPPRKPIQRNPAELLRVPPGERQTQRAVWSGLRAVPHTQGLAGSQL